MGIFKKKITCIWLCSHLGAQLGFIQLALQLAHPALIELQLLLQLTDLLPLPFQAAKAALHLCSQLPCGVVFGRFRVRQPSQGGADRSAWKVSEFQRPVGKVVKGNATSVPGYWGCLYLWSRPFFLLDFFSPKSTQESDSWFSHSSLRSSPMTSCFTALSYIVICSFRSARSSCATKTSKKVRFAVCLGDTAGQVRYRWDAHLQNFVHVFTQGLGGLSLLQFDLHLSRLLHGTWNNTKGLDYIRQRRLKHKKCKKRQLMRGVLSHWKAAEYPSISRWLRDTVLFLNPFVHVEGMYWQVFFPNGSSSFLMSQT